jgi:hypothetical protein
MCRFFQQMDDLLVKGRFTIHDQNPSLNLFEERNCLSLHRLFPELTRNSTLTPTGKITQPVGGKRRNLAGFSLKVQRTAVISYLNTNSSLKPSLSIGPLARIMHNPG